MKGTTGLKLVKYAYAYGDDYKDSGSSVLGTIGKTALGVGALGLYGGYKGLKYVGNRALDYPAMLGVIMSSGKK